MIVRIVRPWNPRFARVAVAVAVVAAGAATAVAVPGTLRLARRTLSSVGTADPHFLVLAGVAFGCSAVASALAWHAVVRACGAAARRGDVFSRYVIGSLVNSAAPGPVGEATRVALVGKLLEGHGGLASATGVMAAVASVRILVIAAIAALALRSAGGAPAIYVVVAAVAISAVIVAALLHRRARSIVRASPAVIARVVGWVTVSTAARVAAAGACCAALGVTHPLTAGLVIVPALELAKAIPLTPANVGITSAAVTLALRREHVPLPAAISTGIVLHVVETIAGCALGLGGALAIARPTLARRLVPVAVALSAAAAIGVWAVDMR